MNDTSPDIKQARRTWAALDLADAARSGRYVQLPSADLLEELAARFHLLCFERGLDLEHPDDVATVCAVLDALTRVPGPEWQALAAASLAATAHLDAARGSAERT